MENRRSRNRKMGKLCIVKGLLSCAHQTVPYFITRVGAGQPTKPIFLTIQHGSNLPFIITQNHRVLPLTSRAAPGWMHGLSIRTLMCQCQAAGNTLVLPLSKTNINLQSKKITVENTFFEHPTYSDKKRKGGGRGAYCNQQSVKNNPCINSLISCL